MSILLLYLHLLYINLRLWRYLLQIWQGQLMRYQSLTLFWISGFWSLILFLNSNTGSISLLLFGKDSYILGPKYIKAFSPLNTIFTIGKLKSEIFLKLWIFSTLGLNSSFTMGGEMPLITLKISLARKRIFCRCIVTELCFFFSRNSSDVEHLSLCMIPKHRTCRRLIILFLILPWHIQTKAQ